MTLASTLQAVIKAVRVALAAILLVGVPLADAAICGAEAAPANEVAALADAGMVDAGGNTDDRDGGARHSGEAEHCIHGHCHHVTPLKNDDGQPVVVSATRQVTSPRENGFVLARMVTGLERPPKA